MARLPTGQEMWEFALPNGLRVHGVMNPGAPVATFQVWYGVGSRDEQLDPDLRTTGLAHLFEHMMFRGTPSIPDGEFDRILTREGGVDLNASTWFDRTNYYGSMPKEGLELILRMEADRMRNLVIDSARLETERNAVLGEYNMGKDDPESEAIDHLYREVFRVHPYGYPTIGTEREIRSFTLEQAELFYRRYYSPNNARVLVVGDVEIGPFREWMERYFGMYSAQEIPHPVAPSEPDQAGRRDFLFRHPQMTQTSLLMGFKVPEASHPDQAALWVLQALFTFGKSSWLEEAWVGDGYASSADGSVDQFKDPGLLVLAADVHDRVSPETLVELFFKHLQRMRRMGRSFESHVERAKNQILFQIYQQWDENSNFASYMGEWMMATGDLMSGFRFVDQVAAVTPDQVREVATRYLSRDRLTTVVGRGP